MFGFGKDKKAIEIATRTIGELQLQNGICRQEIAHLRASNAVLERHLDSVVAQRDDWRDAFRREQEHTRYVEAELLDHMRKAAGLPTAHELAQRTAELPPGTTTRDADAAAARALQAKTNNREIRPAPGPVRT